MKPTIEQQRVIDFSSNLNRSIKLIAFAGTGKTTTLIQIANELDQQGKRGLYLAFNKVMAEEALTKFKKEKLDSVSCSTFHGLAYRSIPEWLREKLNRPTLLPKDIVEKFGLNDLKKNIYCINKKNSLLTIGLMVLDSIKFFCMSNDHSVKIEHVTKALTENGLRDLPEEIQMRIMKVAEAIWMDALDPNGIYGVTHDYYLKWWVLTKPKLDFDYFLMDESQDADGLILDVLERQEGCTIYVGDPHQQIYAFRGAKNILQNLDYQAFYLQQSFRFGQEVADLANLCLKNLLDESKELKGLSSKQCTVSLMPKNYSYNDLDAIVCRTNGNAFEYFFEIQEQIGDSGKNIELEIDFEKSMNLFKGILTLKSGKKPKCPELESFNSFSELMEHLKIYKEVESANTDLATYVDLSSRYSMEDLEQALKAKENRKKDRGVITICTAHKSKGLEFDKVLLAPGFNYEIFGDTVRISDDEARLIYVAITRAKSCLFYDGIEDLIKFLKGKKI